jgi:hypothetical protein
VVGEEAFNAWGWRLPFLFSAGPAGDLDVDPPEAAREPDVPEAEGRGHPLQASPARKLRDLEANLKTVLIALFAIMIAQGAVWYAVFFYASPSSRRPSRSRRHRELGDAGRRRLSVPLYIFFGWLSDKIGRKPVMIGGMALFCVALFPGFHALTQAGNPALAQARRTAPVTVTADPADCSFQFDPVGKALFRSSCDIAKSSLPPPACPTTTPPPRPARPP